MVQKEVFELIRKLTGQSYVLTIPREFITRLDGDVCAALFLSQLLYWSDKGYDNWIFKSYDEWESEIGLKRHKVSTIRAKLESMGLVSTRLQKVNGSPTLHYYVNQDAVVRWLIEDSVFPVGE